MRRRDLSDVFADLDLGDDVSVFVLHSSQFVHATENRLGLGGDQALTNAEHINLGALAEDILNNILDFLASQISSLTNPTNVANAIGSMRQEKVNSALVSAYISHTIDAFLIRMAQRYDVKGKSYFNYPNKYYYTDIGLRNARLNYRQYDPGHIMENIIYNELVTRGYSVDVGMVEIKKQDKDGKWVRIQLEVDFIASLGSKKYYVQSALSIPDREKEIQESRSLTNINDSFKKVIIVKDHIMPRRNEDGILTIGLFDFLLKEDSLDI